MQSHARLSLGLLQRQRLQRALTEVPLTLRGPQNATLDRINGKRLLHEKRAMGGEIRHNE
jgi:hypothetical protein